MIEVRSLVFDYPGKRALKEVSFSLRQGSITALVGPNGAGKTTLLRCLAALEEPVSGTILLDGRDILADPRATHRQIGYLSDFFGLYEELTAQQCLDYAALSHGVDPETQPDWILSCARQLEIDGKLNQKAGSLSRGQRQRLAIAQAIIHRPRLLLLDEPASGLDPESRHSLSLLFRRLQEAGMTLLVSSHILSELEEYCTDMLVLQEGRIIDNTPLVAREEQALFELRVAEALPDLENALLQLAGVEIVRVNQGSALISCSSDPARQHELLREMIAGGLRVCAFGQSKQNMQDVYLRTVQGDRQKGVR
ncbi:ABC transporter ATP-binding protein [Geomonas sp. Red32]|uniref:ABC transporter ATP-binding protein n=1 Tax=Geomonas sp. Red32 TaxID=2912856 RepID=UPI00202CFC9E|nr:ABC transporter ATP-binding protein [Geomonas sp. Red32]MCM0083641.1 ABC transporter ATP-binding protein [Geomonas sp. Red32]